MKSRKQLKSKTLSNKQTIQSETRLKKQNNDFSSNHLKKRSDKSLNSTDRGQRAAMMSRIQYLDDQYKRLFHSYKHNIHIAQLVQENQRLNIKVQKLKEEKNEQKGKVKELEEELKKGKELKETSYVPVQKYLELESRYLQEKEARLLLESDNSRWNSSKENVRQNYGKVIEMIEKLKTEMVE